MAWAYLTEKQMPQSFWFFAITHAACMMNAIPGKVAVASPHPFSLFMMLATTNARGSLCNLCATTFITQKMEISPVLNIKPTLWMVSLLAAPLHLIGGGTDKIT